MELDDAVERIIGLAKNGKKDIYDKLSEQSLIELKEHSEQGIVKSLQRLFTDLYSWDADNQMKETSENAEAYFQNSRTNKPVRVTFTKEAEEWKILWNLNNFLEYQ